MKTSWNDVWENKAEAIETPSLIDLMRMDGYDISCSSVGPEELVKFTLNLKEKLKLQEASHILEVGCGAGAICKILSDNGMQITGIDYTKKLVDIARKVMPSHEFHCADAVGYELSNKQYDLVLCHSVCHYFPSDEYMTRALDKMLDHCGNNGIIAITDVHDADLEDEHIRRRKETIGEELYEKLYADLSHTFFKKSLFTNFAATNNLNIDIEDQFLKSESGKFKFNVYLTKK